MGLAFTFMQITFTFYWLEVGPWEGADFIIHIGSLLGKESTSADRGGTDDE